MATSKVFSTMALPHRTDCRMSTIHTILDPIRSTAMSESDKLWKNTLCGTLAKKCGEKRCWEDWAKDVAELAKQHIETLQKLADDETHRCDFMAFLEHLRSNLNDSITEQEAVEMLAQHIITKPVFDVLFDSEDFSKNNPVSQALDKIVALLEDAIENGRQQTADGRKMEEFYESVRTRVAGIKTAEGRQKIIIELYDKFFKTAFPKLSGKLGIVYTPVEVVDFILKSVDQAFRQEFGKGIGAKGVHILDPFTGTGTFIVRLLQSGLINTKDLYRKYHEELHANEIVLLAYYIAAINIHYTYHEQNRNRKIAQQESQSDDCGSEPFPGIVHTDTFTMTQDKKMVNDTNSERTKKQRDTTISVIIGNPPYSAGAKEFGDGTKRTVYRQLEERVRQTYAEESAATNKNSLYDSYIRSFRWASDRIGEKGIICFVTNGGWLDGNAMDGFRKCLAEEFTDIYVFNLRGGVRGKWGDAAKKEGQNIFSIMTQVAITLGIKNPKKADKPCNINYYEFDDYLKQSEKLQFLTDAGGLQGIQWKKITPNTKHDWLNQRSEDFDSFIGIDKIFTVKTLGVQTNRDAWCYNFSKIRLVENITRMIAFYNEQVKEYVKCKQLDEDLEAEDFIVYNPKKISWSRSLKNCLKRQVKIQFSPQNTVSAVYRPFCKSNFYFHRHLNHEVSQMPRVFPEPGLENVAIAIETGKMGQTFSCLLIDTVPDCCVFGYTQCFALYTYERVEEQNRNRKTALIESQSDVCGFCGERIGNYIRHENISDLILQTFRGHYDDHKIMKEDILYYVYGILHSRSYRERYAADLKKQLPKIPFADDFRAFSKAGSQLAEMHLNYETGKMYPLREVWNTHSRNFQITQMKFPSKTDKSKIIYNAHLTLDGIPPEVYRYIVNGKSALDWIVERYAVTTHKDSSIVNDPNDWCHEIGNERYIVDIVKRIVHLSVESVKIIDGLPELRF